MKKLLPFFILVAITLSGCATMKTPDPYVVLERAEQAEAGVRPNSKKGMYWVSTLAELRTLDIDAAGTPNNYDLIENDTAIMINITGTTGTFSLYVFDASSEAAESVPDIIQPSDFATAGNWILAGLSFLGDDLDLNGYDITGVGVLYPDGYGATAAVIDAAADFSTTFTGSKLTGGTFICDTTGTSSLPAGAAGMNFSYQNRGAVTPTIDPNSSEQIFLNGATCGAGVTIVGSGAADDMAVFQWDGTYWEVRASGFSCGS